MGVRISNSSLNCSNSNPQTTHIETTSMKGLVLSNLNRKEEGLELVKKGVRLDISSHICWHVYGIVHKADRNYDEALRCYLQALRYDKVLFRDLSVVILMSDPRLPKSLCRITRISFGMLRNCKLSYVTTKVYKRHVLHY
jgi:tetratricopeptide (TPR) repeat protein